MSEVIPVFCGTLNLLICSVTMENILSEIDPTFELSGLAEVSALSTT
jgi:hypothetical protein